MLRRLRDNKLGSVLHRSLVLWSSLGMVSFIGSMLLFVSQIVSLLALYIRIHNDVYLRGIRLSNLASRIGCDSFPRSYQCKITALKRDVSQSDVAISSALNLAAS